MATTTSQRPAGASARDLPGKGSRRLALLVAGLLVAPLLARPALAQRPAAIHASAFVVDSYLATGLRTDTAVVAPAAARQEPTGHQLRITGVGVLDVRSGSDTAVVVASQVVTTRGVAGATILVSVTYLGN